MWCVLRGLFISCFKTFWDFQGQLTLTHNRCTLRRQAPTSGTFNAVWYKRWSNRGSSGNPFLSRSCFTKFVLMKIIGHRLLFRPTACLAPRVYLLEVPANLAALDFAKQGVKDALRLTPIARCCLLSFFDCDSANWSRFSVIFPSQCNYFGCVPSPAGCTRPPYLYVAHRPPLRWPASQDSASCSQSYAPVLTLCLCLPQQHADVTGRTPDFSHAAQRVPVGARARWVRLTKRFLLNLLQSRPLWRSSLILANLKAKHNKQNLHLPLSRFPTVCCCYTRVPLAKIASHFRKKSLEDSKLVAAGLWSRVCTWK